MPKVLNEQRDFLNGDITEEEIQSTIKQLGLGKVLGPEGFTSEFYKTLREHITPTLAHYFNNLLNTGGIRPESNHAFIIVLPKPGRDPLCPGSYRPISLIDQDLKMLCKILADHLATFLPQLNGPSQVGFVKGRSAVSNI